MDEPDVCTRLFKQPKTSKRKKKTANDAVISDLPSETLRWIKMHRRLDSDSKMVLSHNREKQLRDIFNGIDVGKHGSIHITELTEAVSFVSERLKNQSGNFAGFDKIIDIFLSMDDNGDGEVDFREFTNAMSGSAKSALNKASEQDIAKLHRCFLEFGVLKARRYAIVKINEYTGLTFVGEGARNFRTVSREEEEAQAKLHKNDAEVIDDLRSYRLFCTLFEEKRDVSGSHPIKREESLDEKDEVPLTPEEVLLQEFHAENKRLLLEGTADPAKEAQFDDLHARLKQARLREAAMVARDPEALAMQHSHEEALRYFAARRREQPQRLLAARILGVDGKPIPNTLNAIPAPAPSHPNTRRDLQTQLAAKREACDLFRALRYLSPLERQVQLGLAGTTHSSSDGNTVPPVASIPEGERETVSRASGSARSSQPLSRSSSNLPTSRRHRHTAALQQSRSLQALLSDDRPGTAPPAVTVTVTVTAPRLLETSPLIANVPPSSMRVRPGTAGAISRGTGGVGLGIASRDTERPKTATQRLRLRSPLRMRGGLC